MKKFVSFFGAIMVLVGVFGVSYTWHVDNRVAEHLSAYCRIDFRSSYTETGKLEGAVFTMWDYRYGGEKLLPKAVLYTDGLPWEMQAAIKQTPPPHNLFGMFPQNKNAREDDGEHPFQNENKLFAELPRSSLAAIRKAETIRLRFYYDNGDTIDLPLSAPDTEYWRRQVAE